jgi:gamma-polyglutamate synthase
VTASPHLCLADALDLGYAPLLCPTYSDLRDEAVVACKAGRRTVASFATHARGVANWTQYLFDQIQALHEAAKLFNLRHANAVDEAERRLAIIDLARRLGATPKQLRSDRQALDKYFDADAVQERYRHRVGERERALAYALERLGLLAGRALAEGEINAASPLLATTLANLLIMGRGYRGDSRVRLASHRCILHMAQSAPAGLSGFWVETVVRDARRVALDAAEDCWSQCDALSALLALSPESFVMALDRRLSAQSDEGSPLRIDNRMFVRRHIARLLCGAVAQHPHFEHFLQKVSNDRNGAVRQALAEALPDLPNALFDPLFTRLRVDRDPQVRAMLFADPAAMAKAGGAATFLKHLLRVLERDKDEFVLRVAIEAATGLAAWLANNDEAALTDAAVQLRLMLAKLRARSETIKVRRWAGEASEQLWVFADPEARALAAELTETIASMREGKSRKIKALRAPLEADETKVGRILSVLAQTDFGFDLAPGRRPVVQRGDRFGRRLWRLMHEFRNSATDKRQAFFHTIGRIYPGSISAPSARMAELAPTKVPGEPLFQGGEGGWRNYVPMLDQILSTIDRSGETRLFTAEGITTITPPRRLHRRIAAYWRISREFSALAALRNRDGGDYTAALRARGVDIQFAAHPLPNGDTPGEPDAAVARFFSVGGIFAALPLFWDQTVAYFSTVYANTLSDLAVFLVLASGYFFGRHMVRGWQMRRLRNGLSLVLGGWGTRGKSGTERLKAGLMNALGHPLVSKTTGCEAMFLLGRANGELIEMFLFRPYDKATIWEQFDLVKTSRGLGARIFLWECMGLNPSYVKVLQQHWMRDDIGTITNTYPDHEDVQGPAGRNIPEVMTQFIPHHSLLLTTEEEMLPILREGAEKAQTRMRPVYWKHAGLVHQRLLDRFPYAEHPNNIALVTAMADELGLEADFAVKEMSDRVVADLGVLKIYPHSVIGGRTLEFVMGMSANERFGAMGNWTRMGFAAHDLGVDPEIYVTTVVNNRADRVPRSRVFAQMMVEDLSVDKHFLIGSNIEGLNGFIEEAWAEHAAALTLFEEETTPLAALEKHAKRHRVPLTRQQVDGRLAAMLAPQSEKIVAADILAAASQGRLAEALATAGADNAEAIAAHYDEQLNQLAEYEKIHAAVAAGGSAEQLDPQARSFLRDRFMEKLVPVREYYTPGEEIVRLVARNTPPGLVNRILGMQNIKGTGLDWVYRWQAWETVHRACVQARDADSGVAARGIATLSTYQEYGALSEAVVRETVAALKASPTASDAIVANQLDGIIARLDAQLAVFNTDETTGDDNADSQAAQGGGFGESLTSFLEQFLDSTDAVRRRRAADRIYDALIAEQISSQRAALELKKLTSRQKGGWLSASISAATGKITSYIPRRSGNVKAH